MILVVVMPTSRIVEGTVFEVVTQELASGCDKLPLR